MKWWQQWIYVCFLWQNCESHVEIIMLILSHRHRVYKNNQSVSVVCVFVAYIVPSSRVFISVFSLTLSSFFPSSYSSCVRVCVHSFVRVFVTAHCHVSFPLSVSLIYTCVCLYMCISQPIMNVMMSLYSPHFSTYIFFFLNPSPPPPLPLSRYN